MSDKYTVYDEKVAEELMKMATGTYESIQQAEKMHPGVNWKSMLSMLAHRAATVATNAAQGQPLDRMHSDNPEPYTRPEGGAIPEVRLNDDKTLDEVVTPHFQLEQMDRDHWFLCVDSGGKSVAVWLYSKSKITATYEWRDGSHAHQGGA